MVDKKGPATVRSSYDRVATKLDSSICHSPPDTVGPFRSALQNLHGGHITPLVSGAFGECSSDVTDLLKHCALRAAATSAGIQLTPDTDVKSLYSSRNLLFHDFQMVLGCCILRANVDLKFKRLPFIRSSVSQAKDAVLFTTKKHSPFFEPDFHSWFRNVGDGGVYDLYYRYINQRSHYGDHSPFASSMAVHAVI